MKKIITLMITSIVMMSFTMQSNTDAIIKALKSGNADNVSNYFDTFIDLKLPEKDEIKNVGKNQAGISLKTFYENNDIKTFELTSQREMGGTMYIAGKLQNAGKGYNITVMLKSKENKYQIITVRINN